MHDAVDDRDGQDVHSIVTQVASSEARNGIQRKGPEKSHDHLTKERHDILS
jgi:hypothetical protein